MMENNLSEELLEQEYFEHFRFVADPGQELLRIDKFLMHKLANASRTRIQKAAENACIRVQDKPVKSNYRVKPGDVITVVLPTPPRDNELRPENIPLNIVFEDEHLLIVNKPAGMVVHPGYNNYTGTLVNALVYHFDNLPQRDADHRPGLVHRIDKDTSGLLVIAKTESVLTHLARQFFEHTIQRSYVALVWGEPEPESGTITGYLARDPADRRRVKMFSEEEGGKYSVTHYRTLEKFGFLTLLECRLETGRTHQIRAHMRSIGHPLFNDAMYGGDKVLKGNTTLARFTGFIENCFEALPRQALHARTLGFEHPVTGEWIYKEAPLPDDLAGVLDKLRRYTSAK